MLISSVIPLSHNNSFARVNYNKTTLPHELNSQTQELVPVEDIYSNTLDILVARKNETGSWALPSYSGDTTQYTGIAGGMAGIGLQLLNAYQDNATWVSSTTNERLLSISEEIGNELLTYRSIDNSTNSAWNVSLSSDIMDVSYDFGLSGIAYFYSELYNVTQDQTYLDIANTTITTIYQLTNASTSFNWQFDLLNILYPIESAQWYSTLDYSQFVINAFTDGTKYAFTGMNTGVAGIAATMLKFVVSEPNGYNSYAGELLNTSMDWLNNLVVTDGVEKSIPMVESGLSLNSTSLATGMAGLGQLYLNMYEYSSNTTYLDTATGMMNWLNGTNNDNPRYIYSIPDNTTLEGTKEYGYQYGIAGIAEFFYNLGVIENDNGIQDLAKNNLNYVMTQGYINSTGSQLSFKYSSLPQDPTTTGWARGTGGIFEVTMKIGTALNDVLPGGLVDKATQMRHFLINQAINENNLTSIRTGLSGQLENNPSIGMPGMLQFLGLQISGELYVADTSVSFGEVKIDKSVSTSIEIQNIGESDILVSWNNVSANSAFATTGQDLIIGSYSSKSLFISFIPTKEQAYSAILTLSSNGKEFTVQLSGSGYDNPQITSSASVANNSILSSYTSIDFQLTATDSSLLDKAGANININGVSAALTSSTDSNVFTFTWNTNNIANGTYTLTFTISDVNGHSSHIQYVYVIDVYTSNLKERAFSDAVRNILIGFMIVLVIGAIILTRKYMSNS